MSKVFQRVAAARPGRSVFNLSYEKKFTCDMGQLIPTMCDEVVPGDVFKMGNEVVIRFQPMIAPMLHEVNAYIHYFFVPYRLMWDEWEDFISGGVDGEYSATLPTWQVTGADGDNAIGSLWDYFGFPTGVVPAGAYPLDFPRIAYNFVFNEYYRDETLVDEVDLGNEKVLRRAWEKDYFTSALPWQQRGTAPALPVSGTTSAVFPAFSVFDGIPSSPAAVQAENATTPDNRVYVNGANGAANVFGMLNSNTVDLSTATTFNVADLRLAFQIQKWMERNARSGARYTEFLAAHFGVSPRDERLQRPEYIGGMKSPVVVSEVLQTSSTDATTPQGNLAGHGITVDRRNIGTYRAKEYGLIIGIMSVMPRSAYQQGIDRQWLRRTKYDFFFPEFANLSEQAIEQVEIYASNTDTENVGIFGYQGRYDEMRVKRNMVAGYMRDTLDYWHLGRQFATAPALNEDFVTCNPSKRIFAVQDEPGLIVNVANVIKAVRPMPIQSNPGLIDHG